MNEPIAICLQVVGVTLAADFAAGFIHWIEDAYIRENTPLLGRFIGKPNTIHHHLPRYMIRNSWWRSNREQLIAMGVLLAFLSLLNLVTWRECLFALVAGYANVVHKWSHRTRRENGRLICWLQDLHVLQTPRHHAVHHSNPKQVRYCPVTNVLNPLLDGIHLWAGIEWAAARVFGLHRQPDTSVPGQGTPPEWICSMRRSD